MLDSAARLLEHDIAVAGVIVPRRAVRDGEVALGAVAVEEDCDVEDLAGVVVVEVVEGELAVCGDVEGDVKVVWEGLLV